MLLLLADGDLRLETHKDIPFKVEAKLLITRYENVK